MRGFMREASKRWTYENGEPFDMDAIYPAVDVIGNRVYGIKKDNHEDVVVVHSYDPISQRNSARNFALWLWGPAHTWERPDTTMKIASCLGMPACASCMLDPLPMLETVPNWRIKPFGESDKVYAHTLSATNTYEDHLIADMSHENDMSLIQKELLRRCIALFGEPYDLASGKIAPTYEEALQQHGN